MPNVGVWEILVLLLVLLLVFGPKRLPQLGRSLGHGVRELKDSVGDTGRELKEAVADTPREIKESLTGTAPEEPPPSPRS